MEKPLKVHFWQHPEWLTNTFYLEGAGISILIDAGAHPREFAKLEYPQALFLTHTHHDHITYLNEWRSTGVKIYQPGSPEFSKQETLDLLGLRVNILHTPGHLNQHYSFLVNNSLFFAGDLIFKNTVAGTSGGSVAELRNSIMQKVITLPAQTIIYPGHGPASTVAEEQQYNPFVRAWSGTVALGDAQIEFAGRKAQVLALADDYDGDKKAWLRFADNSELITAL